jgi:hypothetical protein
VPQECCHSPFFSFLEDKKQGNSDHIDRIDLVELFIQVFGLNKIEVLLGDREFIGDLWLNWLEEQGISYVMRIKEAGQYISNSRGMMVMAKDLLHNLRPGEKINLGKRRLGKDSKTTHHLSAYRHHKTGELLVVVHSSNITNACELYKYRWQIETMFKAFKSSGFNLEDTKVVNYDKLETLISVMMIAFTISYEVGDDYEDDHPQKLKKHGYKAVSTYKIGINLIKNWLFNCWVNLVRMMKKILMKTAVQIDGRWGGRKNVV